MLEVSDLYTFQNGQSLESRTKFASDASKLESIEKSSMQCPEDRIREFIAVGVLRGSMQGASEIHSCCDFGSVGFKHPQNPSHWSFQLIWTIWKELVSMVFEKRSLPSLRSVFLCGSSLIFRGLPMIFTDLSSAQARSCASWVLLALGRHPSASLLPRPVFHPGLVIIYVYIYNMDIWLWYDYDMFGLHHCFWIKVLWEELKQRNRSLPEATVISWSLGALCLKRLL